MRVGRVTWTEFQVPAPATVRQARVTWAELEVPEASLARQGRVTWVEFEVPTVSLGRQGRVTWAEFEIPSAGSGVPVLIFKRIAKARTSRISRPNYNVVPVSSNLYSVTQFSSVSSDKISNVSYEGYEFL